MGPGDHRMGTAVHAANFPGSHDEKYLLDGCIGGVFVADDFRRWSRWSLVAAIMLIGVLDIFYVYHFRALVDEFFVATISRTNTEETAEFLESLSLLPVIESVAWLFYCGFLGVFLDRETSRVLKNFSVLRWSWIPGVLIWVGLVFAYMYGSGATRFEIKDKVRNIYPLHAAWAVVTYGTLNDAVMYTPVLPAIALDGKQAETIVVVLGESASAQRWSALGYARSATNEPLRNLSNSFVAKVLAQDFQTAGALPFVLTGYSMADSIAKKSPSFLDLAKRAGYKVFVYNNSRSLGNGDFFEQVLRRSSDVYEKMGNGGSYDEILTPSIRRALRDSAPRKLVVLHTFGSHEIVANRYPKSYERFTDDYDNSIYYTSVLLREWINLLQQFASGSALLLYTSDHGLGMPPCSTEYIHRRGLSSLEVPFFLWSNDIGHFEFPEIFSRNGQYGNSILGEMVTRLVGYRKLTEEGEWPGSDHPKFEGHTWQELSRMNACTLR